MLVDKPSGWTSFDVVAKVRGTLRQSLRESAGPSVVQSSSQTAGLHDSKTGRLPKPKVGHTGTLDPLATGLLVICLGSYCKRAQEFSKSDKVYEVTMTLGQTSTTGDEEGEKSAVNDHQPSLEELEAALQQFMGQIMQTPPAYSAVKVNGQRAYKLAREGKEVVIEPRQVTIYSIVNVRYAYPEVIFTTKVSSGTYIRSLVQDVGEVLNTGAYMSGLVRTKIAEFDLKNAIQMDGIDAEVVKNNLLEVEEIVPLSRHPSEGWDPETKGVDSSLRWNDERDNRGKEE